MPYSDKRPVYYYSMSLLLNLISNLNKKCSNLSTTKQSTDKPQFLWLLTDLKQPSPTLTRSLLWTRELLLSMTIVLFFLSRTQKSILRWKEKMLRKAILSHLQEIPTSPTWSALFRFNSKRDWCKSHAGHSLEWCVLRPMSEYVTCFHALEAL